MGNKNIILWLALITIINCWSCTGSISAEEDFPRSDVEYSEGRRSKESVPDTSDENVHSDPMVLCYHQIRNPDGNDSKTARPYIVPISKFSEQMKLLHDSGYYTILPNQLVNFYLHGEKLPGKPILLTFDDGTASQIINALPELDKYGFKASFFVMTVTIDCPEYMTSNEIKYLSDHGHIIGCHTWDHHNVTQYGEDDWEIQLKKPSRLLQKITGKPMEYFAYPYGAWNLPAIEHLKGEGYQAAFQLSGKRDKPASLYTIRRIIVDGNWSMKQFCTRIAL